MSLLPSILAPSDPAVDVATSPIVSSPFVQKILRFAPYCSPNSYVPPPLEGFAYASIENRLYIFGGSDLNGAETNDLYVFTLKSGWQKVESQNQNDNEKPSPRVAAAMTPCGQTLYLFGGINAENGWLNDLYKFDTDKSWERIGNIDEQTGPSPRDKVALIASRGKIYLYGGFGPCKQTAAPDHCTTTNPNGISSTSASAIDDESSGDINGGALSGKNGHDDIAASGESASEAGDEKECETIMKSAKDQQIGAEFDYFNDFYCFDLCTGQWLPVELDLMAGPATEGDDNKNSTPPGLAAYTVCASGDKLLYFGGKTSYGERTNVTYCFALGLKKWLPLPVWDDSNWPKGRSFHSSAVIGDRYLLTFGGRDTDDWERDDLWLLDINQMQWMKACCEGVGGVSAPCARYGHAMAVLPDADSRLHLVIYGGSAELDPASGVAQDLLTDMYVVPVDEIAPACTPIYGGATDGDKEAKHQHHLMHHRKANPTDEGESSNDEPASKVPRCDDCIDL